MLARMALRDFPAVDDDGHPAAQQQRDMIVDRALPDQLLARSIGANDAYRSDLGCQLVVSGDDELGANGIHEANFDYRLPAAVDMCASYH